MNAVKVVLVVRGGVAVVAVVEVVQEERLRRESTDVRGFYPAVARPASPRPRTCCYRIKPTLLTRV